MITKYKIAISIFIIWLFNISGIFGILSSNSDWFLQLTPVNLLMYVVVIIWCIEDLSKRFIIAFFIPFLIGFVTEYLGVNYGLIFGSYAYGENLGLKLGGVPLMICINWAVLTIITADLSSVVNKNILVRSLFGGFTMMLLDFLIEVSAPRFDFWEFENSIIPIQNYLAWFIIGSIAHYLYHQMHIKTNKKVSIHIFVAIIIFFSTFIIY